MRIILTRIRLTLNGTKAMQDKDLPFHGRVVLYAIAFAVACFGLSILMLSLSMLV